MDALGLAGVVDKFKSAFQIDGFTNAKTSLTAPSSKVSSYPNVCIE